jgi:hypothetical protein
VLEAFVATVLPDSPQGGKGDCKSPAKAWGVRFSHLALMACNSTAEYSTVNRKVEGSNPSTPAMI